MTLAETAEREVLEETGIVAGKEVHVHVHVCFVLLVFLLF